MAIDMSKTRRLTLDGLVPMENPYDLHPEVRERLSNLIKLNQGSPSRSYSPLDATLLLSLWDNGEITPEHRRITLMQRMSDHLKSRSMDALMGASMNPMLHDTPARRSITLLTTYLDSLMELEQYDDRYQINDVIWNAVDWDAIANGFLESSTFDSRAISHGSLRVNIPLSLSPVLMNIMNPARNSSTPKSGTLGEHLDSQILLKHQDALINLLGETQINLSFFLDFHRNPRDPQSVAGLWKAHFTPEEGAALYVFMENWRWSDPGHWHRADKTNYGMRYYMENAGYFTLENMRIFARLILEYNEEWAIAAMEWS